jgi:hypothetical protein
MGAASRFGRLADAQADASADAAPDNSRPHGTADPVADPDAHARADAPANADADGGADESPHRAPALRLWRVLGLGRRHPLRPLPCEADHLAGGHRRPRPVRQVPGG